MWAGYVFCCLKKTRRQTITIVDNYALVWRKSHSPMADIGHCPGAYISKCMLEMAAFTEHTRRASNKIRTKLNSLYKSRGGINSGKALWESLTPSMDPKYQESLNWGK